jgi:hypothetical protein
LFTHGWNVYNPGESYVYHQYERKNQKFPPVTDAMKIENKRLMALLGLEGTTEEVGEFSLGTERTLKEYEEGKTKSVIKKQVLKGLEGLSEEYISGLTIAYEPVWSIGTGKNASKEIASDICKYIVEVIASKYGEEVASGVYVLYGGSVKPNNIKEYLDDEHIDGALVGGASLKPESFIEMIENIRG